MAGFRFDPFRPMRATNTAAVFAVPPAVKLETLRPFPFFVNIDWSLVEGGWMCLGLDGLRVVRPGIDKCCYKREVITGHSPPSCRGRGAESVHSTPLPNDARVSGRLDRRSRCPSEETLAD